MAEVLQQSDIVTCKTRLVLTRDVRYTGIRKIPQY